ncbi:MAG: hypothetical protein J4G00_00365 [Actinomycetia bacterium]|nr:hypothetical protein [Actinomycetes bacterium]
MTATPQNKIGGLLLVIGTILMVGMQVLTPGLVVVDFVDADDFIGLGRVIQENMALSFLTTMLGVLGLVLQLFGVLVLRRAIMGEGANDTIARFGVMALGLGIVISMIDRAVLYTATHTLEYGIGAGAGPDQAQLLDFISVILLKTQSGLNLMAFYAFLLGSIGLGIGLMTRFRAAAMRTVAVVMVLSCLVSLVFVAVISPLYGLAGSFFTLFLAAVLLGNTWLVMMGLGLYNGRPELSNTTVAA